MIHPKPVKDTLGYVGQTVAGKYAIDRPVGRGAFAIVYHGTAPDGSDVAIKIPCSDEVSASFRFKREIKVMESLPSSSHLVSYMTHGTLPDGSLYLVMEFVDGPTLKDALQTWTVLPPDQACACIGQIALALQTLHRFGIVHRDLKPSNVLLAADGEIKLFDFGLLLDTEGMLRMFEQQDILEGRDFAEAIEEGIVVGTPEYMAIEQFQDARWRGRRPRQTCPASDVFSAGVILYRLITGQLPFPMRLKDDHPRTGEIAKYLMWRTNVSDVDLSPPQQVDGALWGILCRALATAPGKRQANGKALAQELFRYLAARGDTERDEVPILPTVVDDPVIMAEQSAATKLANRELFDDLKSSPTIEEVWNADDEPTLRRRR
jgi:serine/threonine protein kinase